MSHAFLEPKFSINTNWCFCCLGYNCHHICRPPTPPGSSPAMLYLYRNRSDRSTEKVVEEECWHDWGYQRVLLGIHEEISTTHATV